MIAWGEFDRGVVFGIKGRMDIMTWAYGTNLLLWGKFCGGCYIEFVYECLSI